MLPPATKTANSLQLRRVVSATPEAVWSSFTDPAHLVRWFPLQASVVPGVSGTMRLSWGDIGSAWRISAWQPAQFLEVRELQAFASKADEDTVRQENDANSSGWRVSIEELSGSQTLITLEHFGLSGSPEIFSIVERGWNFELLSLRYYLERQFGRDRLPLWTRAKLECEAGCEAEIWESLAGTQTELPGKIELEQVEIQEPPWQFAATLRKPASSLFRVKIERVSQNEIEVNLWLAAYGSSLDELQHLQAGFEQRIQQIKAAGSEEGQLACRSAR